MASHSGWVAAGHPETRAAALATLEAGGNAVDAVISAGLVSFGAEPLLASAGGGGLLVAAIDGQPVRCVDFFPRAPGLGGGPPQPDFHAIEVDFGPAQQRFHVGRASAAVPTALLGFDRALSVLGRLGRKRVAAPAIAALERGVARGRSGEEVFALLRPILELHPDTREALGGAEHDASLERPFPALASCLRDWVREGGLPKILVEGTLSAFAPERGGWIRSPDLEAAEPTISEAHRLSFRSWEIYAPPGAGARALEHTLAGLEASSHPEAPGGTGLALAQAGLSFDRRRREMPASGRGSTTHISVLDSEGGLASLTLSNGEGCGYLAPGTGIQLNNYLGEEDLNPGGFFRHAPGAPLPTMMCPLVVRGPSGQALALGTGGSNRIRSALATVIESLSRGASIPAAVMEPRVHAEVGQLAFESALGLPEDALRAWAEDEGLRVDAFPDRAFFFGGVHVAGRVDRAIALGDPRRDGCPGLDEGAHRS